MKRPSRARTPFTIRLPKEAIAKMTRLAKATGRPVSSLAREILLKNLEAVQNEQPTAAD